LVVTQPPAAEADRPPASIASSYRKVRNATKTARAAEGAARKRLAAELERLRRKHEEEGRRKEEERRAAAAAAAAAANEQPARQSALDDELRRTLKVSWCTAEEGTLLKHQAVLFRTGTHSAPLELELTRRGVPFVKYGGLKFMEAAHVKDVLAALRWADNPQARLAALRTARLVPGLGPASVRRLLDHTGALADYKPPAAAAQPWQAANRRARPRLLRRMRSAAPAGGGRPRKNRTMRCFS
jgi:superfamily I DNA/RNA helicase